MSAHPAEFSPTQISMAHSHNREISVASFASSLYLPVDPDNQPSLDDDADTYPSSDELFGPDHEEGDDYTISSRRYLSSHSRYSSAFSHVSHPPTPPRSTRSTMSLERSSSSLSLTPPPARHSNMDSSCSPSAWNGRPAAIRTMASTAELPSPPSTAHSSNDTHMSASLDKHVADQGVPIEKFDQLALEHLEQDKALLQVLRKLDDQKLRIAQLTYALSRLRVLSNSACLSAPDSGAPIAAGSSSVIQPRRLGVVIPKPLIVRQSSKSATSTIGRSTLLSASTNSTGLSGPSQNEAVNQRRLAKQQLHEFALRRRPTRSAPKGRANNKPTPDVAKRGGWEWEGARGSPSMVAKETKPRTADAVGHPNVTVRRPKRPDPPAHQAKSPARPPRPSITPTASPATPPRLLSLFSSPISITSRSPRTPTQTQLSAPALRDSPTTPVPSRRNKNKPLPTRPVSPTKPMRLARNMSLRYEIPPVPPPEQITAHVTMVDRTTPPLPVDEVKHRLEATFAHFSHKGQSQVPSPLDAEQTRTPGPYELDPRQRAEPDYLEQMLHQKWVAQLDEHSHQARGSWRSPLKLMRQKIAGGLGIGAARKSSRASIGDSSSEAHTSLDTPGYVHGLGTVQEGGVDSEHESTGGGWLAIDKAKKLKKKSGKEEVVGTPKSSKSAWRFSRLASSSS